MESGNGFQIHDEADVRSVEALQKSCRMDWARLAGTPWRW